MKDKIELHYNRFYTVTTKMIGSLSVIKRSGKYEGEIITFGGEIDRNMVYPLDQILLKQYLELRQTFTS